MGLDGQAEIKTALKEPIGYHLLSISPLEVAKKSITFILSFLLGVNE